MNEVNLASYNNLPIYETESDRVAEREAIAQVEFQFDSEIDMTNTQSLFDAVMKKGAIEWAYVELKCRDNKYQERVETEGYMISMTKWDRLRAVTRNDKPVLLVVTFGDEAYGLWVDHRVTYPTRMAGRFVEREGRTRNDFEKRRDKEVCYFIPWEEFTPLWNMD